MNKREIFKDQQLAEAQEALLAAQDIIENCIDREAAIRKAAIQIGIALGIIQLNYEMPQ